MSRVLIGLMLAGLVGCATAAPKQQATNVTQISGNWAGSSYFKGGSLEVQLVVDPSGSFTSTSTRGTGVSGVVKVEQGKFMWTAGARSGEWVLQGHGPDEMLISQNVITASDGQTHPYEVQFKRKK